MGTDSMSLALAQKDLYDCIRSDKSQERELLRSKNGSDLFGAHACSNFCCTCCVKQSKYDEREPGLFKVEIRCNEKLCLCSMTFCYHNFLSNKFKFSSKGLNKKKFEDIGDGSMVKYRKVLDETENVTSTNRGIRTKNHCVATYEQTKKGLSYFCTKRIVELDGNQTLPVIVNKLYVRGVCSSINSLNYFSKL